VHTPGDHVVEHGEGVGGGAQVVLALTDDGAQCVAGNDVLSEVLARPGGLARTGRADEYDEAR
jgi:hypothetical protein